jgi:hypothetical protein
MYVKGLEFLDHLPPRRELVVRGRCPQLTERSWDQSESPFHMLHEALRNVGIAGAAEGFEHARQSAVDVVAGFFVVADSHERECFPGPANRHTRLMNRLFVTVSERRHLCDQGVERLREQ